MPEYLLYMFYEVLNWCVCACVCVCVWWCFVRVHACVCVSVHACVQHLYRVILFLEVLIIIRNE